MYHYSLLPCYIMYLSNVVTCPSLPTYNIDVFLVNYSFGLPVRDVLAISVLALLCVTAPKPDTYTEIKVQGILLLVTQ